MNNTSVLTARSLQTLALAANGYTNDRIGQRLHLSAETVNGHLQNAYVALGALDRAHAVALAIRYGHLNPNHIQPRRRAKPRRAAA